MNLKQLMIMIMFSSVCTMHARISVDEKKLKMHVGEQLTVHLKSDPAVKWRIDGIAAPILKVSHEYIIDLENQPSSIGKEKITILALAPGKTKVMFSHAGDRELANGLHIGAGQIITYEITVK